MRAYRFVCDCGETLTFEDPVEAFDAYLAHTCPNRCAICCRVVPMLVDDSGLCVSCDAVAFPNLIGGPTRSPGVLV